jgi:hypothetical protein
MFGPGRHYQIKHPGCKVPLSPTVIRREASRIATAGQHTPTRKGKAPASNPKGPSPKQSKAQRLVVRQVADDSPPRTSSRPKPNRSSGSSPNGSSSQLNTSKAQWQPHGFGAAPSGRYLRRHFAVDSSSTISTVRSKSPAPSTTFSRASSASEQTAFTSVTGSSKKTWSEVASSPPKLHASSSSADSYPQVVKSSAVSRPAGSGRPAKSMPLLETPSPPASWGFGCSQQQLSSSVPAKTSTRFDHGHATTRKQTLAIRTSKTPSPEFGFSGARLS